VAVLVLPCFPRGRLLVLLRAWANDKFQSCFRTK
jgi:hypothetical protein